LLAYSDALALSHSAAGRQATLSAALDELEDEVADLADVMARVASLAQHPTAAQG